MRLLIILSNYINRGLEFLAYGINFIIVTKPNNISKKARIRGARINGNVIIQEGCKIIDGVSLKTGSSIVIKRYTSINGPNTDVFSQINPIVIGSFTSIARNVSIQEFNHNYDTITSYSIMQNIFGEKKKNDIYSNGSIEIGNDVWIGTQCVILSGAKIGNGAIVAANSVVTGNIPPFAIVAGSPAKVIKYRFEEDIVTLLEDLQWWNWPVEKIKQNKRLFVGKVDKVMLQDLIAKKD